MGLFRASAGVTERWIDLFLSVLSALICEEPGDGSDAPLPPVVVGGVVDDDWRRLILLLASLSGPCLDVSLPMVF